MIYKAKRGADKVPECRAKVDEALKAAGMTYRDAFGRRANGLLRSDVEAIVFRRRLWVELAKTYTATVVAEACWVDRNLLYHTINKEAMKR
jgi:hypothetical protein